LAGRRRSRGGDGALKDRRISIKGGGFGGSARSVSSECQLGVLNSVRFGKVWACSTRRARDRGRHWLCRYSAVSWSSVVSSPETMQCRVMPGTSSRDIPPDVREAILASGEYESNALVSHERGNYRQRRVTLYGNTGNEQLRLADDLLYLLHPPCLPRDVIPCHKRSQPLVPVCAT